MRNLHNHVGRSLENVIIEDVLIGYSQLGAGIVWRLECRDYAFDISFGDIVLVDDMDIIKCLQVALVGVAVFIASHNQLANDYNDKK